MNRRHLALAALLAAALAALVWLTLFRGDDVAMERSVAPSAESASLGSPAAAADEALEAPSPSEAPTRIEYPAPGGGVIPVLFSAVWDADGNFIELNRILGTPAGQTAPKAAE